jgi:tRNA A-37 threonylcarbamoyl transferase component Bud32/tetratricopeptide (TPR) repeat protein
MPSPSVAYDRLQGALGGAYELENELSAGGMARVFTAIETALGRRVVVKVIEPDLAAEVDAERFRREVRVEASLQHPHIVPLLTAREVGGLIFYTMPYVHGETLRARLQRDGPLPAGRAILLLREIADALAYAHGRGVVHRDVKPENVLISAGHAVVTDFGIAKALAAATQGRASGAGRYGDQPMITAAGVVVGTPAYMAPEQAAGDPEVDHRADLYALGVLAYELLTGSAPFAGRSARELVAAHMVEVPQPLDARAHDIPSALGALVMRLLEKDPGLRPQSAAEVVRELDAIIASRRGPRMAGDGAARHSRRERRTALATGAALATLALVGTALVVSDRSQRAPDYKRVVIAPMENRTDDPRFDQLGVLAADWLTQGLAHAGLAEEVVDIATVLLLSQQTAGDPTRTPATDRVRLLASDARADVVVWGAVYRMGDSLHFQTHISDVKGGRILQSIEPVRSHQSQPMVGVSRLRDHTLGALAAIFDERLATLSAAASRAPRFEAYQEYILGFEPFVRRDMKSAIPHFEKAAQLDTTFILARFWQAFAYGNSDQRAKRDSLVQLLEPMRGALSPLDRAALDYFLADQRTDYSAALDAVRRAAQLAPQSNWPYMVGHVALRGYRPREAATALAGLDPTRGWAKSWRDYWELLTTSYHLLGEHERELSAARRAQELSPGEIEPVVLELRALAALGRVTEVETRVAELLTFRASDSRQPIGALWAAGVQLRAHGYPEPGRAMFERALQWHRTHPVGDGTAEVRLRNFPVAQVFYFLGRYQEARALLQKYEVETPTEYRWQAHGWLGSVAARQGDRAEALRTIALLRANRDPRGRGARNYLCARIAALLGDKPGAVAYLREAFPAEVPPQAMWLDFDPDLESLRGYAPFEQLRKAKN